VNGNTARPIKYDGATVATIQAQNLFNLLKALILVEIRFIVHYIY
jgi:hypothetical protein